jgi:outer membrane lipoprotein-sorting protein
MTLHLRSVLTLALALCATAARPQSIDLLQHILAGEQQAQAKFTTACGTVTETRTSKLITKPMVLHGKFCAEGTNRFMLEYLAPNPMTIRVNDNYLNMTATGKTQVMDIGGDFRRVQSSFMGPNSMDNLNKNFVVTAQENSADYELRLVPRTEALKHKLNFLVVRLNKITFLPQILEIDGKSGVNSVFHFEITSTNTKLPEDTFKVSKTK